MRVGLLTSGGDCPGLNAVIRSAVLHGIKTYDYELVGIRDGWRGLIEGDVEDLPRQRVRGLARTGGTILGTSRTHPYNHPQGGPENIKAQMARLGLDAVVAIGGGSTTGSSATTCSSGVSMAWTVPKPFRQPNSDTLSAL